MSTIDLGAPVTAIWTGAPADGTYAITVTRPDGTLVTPAPAVIGPPVRATFVPDQAGRWRVRFTSTGQDAVGAYTDVVDVWPVDPQFIISVDDARNALNLPANAAPSLVEDLRLYIAAATPVIEDIVGPIPQRTEVQRVGKGWSVAALYHKVTSLTSIVYDDATVADASAYTFDAGPGLVTFHYPLTQGATITYKAGSTSVPQNVRLATRELVRHWWTIGKASNRPSVPNQPAEAWTPSGFAVPRRVIELCAPNRRVGGFA